jgi:hypothetical protein
MKSISSFARGQRVKAWQRQRAGLGEDRNRSKWRDPGQNGTHSLDVSNDSKDVFPAAGERGWK